MYALKMQPKVSNNIDRKSTLFKVNTKDKLALQAQ